MVSLPVIAQAAAPVPTKKTFCVSKDARQPSPEDFPHPQRAFTYFPTGLKAWQLKILMALRTWRCWTSVKTN